MKRVAAVGVLALVLLLAGCGGSHRSSGCELIFRAIPTRGQSVTPAGMQLASQIVANRLDTLGVSSPNVAVQHGDEIVIQFAGSHGPGLAAIASVVEPPGQLQMFDFEPSLAPPTVRANQQPAPLSSLYALLRAAQKEGSKETPEAYYLFKTSGSHPVVRGPAPDVHQLLLGYPDGKQPPHTQILKVPARREAVVCRAGADCPGSSGRAKSGQYWYLLKLPAQLTGGDIVESGVTSDIDPNSGVPIVTLQFTHQGSNAFRRMTQAEYNRGRVNAGEAGQLTNASQAVINRYAGHNAIVLDGELKETPFIDYTDPSLSPGIAGNGEILEPTKAAANRTALILQTGSLPYTFTQVSRSSCSRQ